MEIKKPEPEEFIKAEKEFIKHSEIKEYEIKAVENVRGSARHSSKFSTEKAIIEDTKKQIEVLSKLSDHVSDLEKRVAALELASKGPLSEAPKGALG